MSKPSKETSGQAIEPTPPADQAESKSKFAEAWPLIKFFIVLAVLVVMFVLARSRYSVLSTTRIALFLPLLSVWMIVDLFATDDMRESLVDIGVNHPELAYIVLAIVSLIAWSAIGKYLYAALASK